MQIHPRREYEIRKAENKRYAKKKGVPFVDCDYDARAWFDRMKGLEQDPERIGKRCIACFDMRMEVTAAYATKHNFDAFTTTNATSRWKSESQVNGAGLRAAKLENRRIRRESAIKGTHNGPKFWLHKWQTDAFTKRKYQISASERFYKQEYCGCSYSLRDSNVWRKMNGIPPVRIGGEIAGLGTRYFEDPEADAEEESQEVVDNFFLAARSNFKKDVTSTVTDILMDVYAGRRKADTSGRAPDDVAHASLNNW